MTDRPWTIVLDDDPTGTQGLSNVPVIIDPAKDTLRWAYGQSDITYVMTNTRSHSPATAARIVEQVVTLAQQLVDEEGWSRVRFVSRGDSTLRGHFPLEILTIRTSSKVEVAGCILVPAFPVAGRVTIDGVHSLRVRESLIPIAETEFARDATFGFVESDLVGWARRRVSSAWLVERIPSSAFDSGVEEVTRRLKASTDFTVFCPDIRDDRDVETLAAAQRCAEDDGVYFLVQAGPAYPPALVGLPPAHAITEPIFASRPGLIVVGSHTDVTTAQLAPLREAGIPYIEMDVPQIIAERAEQEVARCVDVVSQALTASTVILATSRARHSVADGDESLSIAGKVAAALAEVSRQLIERCSPSFVLSKGGITSHNTLSLALGWRAAVVEGPLVGSTLPVCSSWLSSDHEETYCVIAPGNVGAADLLAVGYARIRELTESPAV